MIINGQREGCGRARNAAEQPPVQSHAIYSNCIILYPYFKLKFVRGDGRPLPSDFRETDNKKR